MGNVTSTEIVNNVKVGKGSSDVNLGGYDLSGQGTQRITSSADLSEHALNPTMTVFGIYPTALSSDAGIVVRRAGAGTYLDQGSPQLEEERPDIELVKPIRPAKTKKDRAGNVSVQPCGATFKHIGPRIYRMLQKVDGFVSLYAPLGKDSSVPGLKTLFSSLTPDSLTSYVIEIAVSTENPEPTARKGLLIGYNASGARAGPKYRSLLVMNDAKIESVALSLQNKLKFIKEAQSYIEPFMSMMASEGASEPLAAPIGEVIAQLNQIGMVSGITGLEDDMHAVAKVLTQLTVNAKGVSVSSSNDPDLINGGVSAGTSGAERLDVGSSYTTIKKAATTETPQIATMDITLSSAVHDSEEVTREANTDIMRTVAAGLPIDVEALPVDDDVSHEDSTDMSKIEAEIPAGVEYAVTEESDLPTPSTFTTSDVKTTTYKSRIEEMADAGVPKLLTRAIMNAGISTYSQDATKTLLVTYNVATRTLGITNASSVVGTTSVADAAALEAIGIDTGATFTAVATGATRSGVPDLVFSDYATFKDRTVIVGKDSPIHMPESGAIDLSNGTATVVDPTYTGTVGVFAIPRSAIQTHLDTGFTTSVSGSATWSFDFSGDTTGSSYSKLIWPEGMQIDVSQGLAKFHSSAKVALSGDNLDKAVVLIIPMQQSGSATTAFAHKVLWTGNRCMAFKHSAGAKKTRVLTTTGFPIAQSKVNLLDMTGNVTDQQAGAPIPGAIATLINPETTKNQSKNGTRLTSVRRQNILRMPEMINDQETFVNDLIAQSNTAGTSYSTTRPATYGLFSSLGKLASQAKKHWDSVKNSSLVTGAKEVYDTVKAYQTLANSDGAQTGVTGYMGMAKTQGTKVLMAAMDSTTMKNMDLSSAGMGMQRLYSAAAGAIRNKSLTNIFRVDDNTGIPRDVPDVSEYLPETTTGAY